MRFDFLGKVTEVFFDFRQGTGKGIERLNPILDCIWIFMGEIISIPSLYFRAIASVDGGH
jgi:hypothetical protein